MKRVSFLALFALSLLLAVGSTDVNPCRVYGDMNGDNVANIADVTALINYLLSGEPAVPIAQHSPNMTIAEFKAKHWQDDVNYVDTVTDDEIIHGWITSSDMSGNIYKQLYIVDESGEGLTIGINQQNLYQYYAIGQEIVLPMQGYYVGKYCGQQQLGYPQWYAMGETWETTFMPQTMWESLVELNGLADPGRPEVQPVEVNLADFQGKTDSETLLQYQGKLVCIKGVSFSDADGFTTYAEPTFSTARVVVDENGNELIVRTSNYADFQSEVLPRGKVDLVGLLSFYATRQSANGFWQLYLRDINDVTVVDPGEDPVEPDPVNMLNEGFDTSLPDDWTNIAVSGDRRWYQTIYVNNGYAAMTGYKGMQPPFDAWLITPAIDMASVADKTLSFRTQVNGYSSTTTRLEVYLLDSNDPTQATVKVQLDPTLPVAPNFGYSEWTESGNVDLSQWADGVYYIGFRYSATQDANYATWCLDDVKLGGDIVNEEYRADLETMGNPTSAYGTRTSANGWVAENSMLLSGGEVNANPIFVFIGYMTNSTTEFAIAPTLNGKTTAVGTLVSPVLHGGMSRLCFNYGAPFSDTVLSFRIDVKQGGEVVKTWTVTDEDVTKQFAYTFDEACSVAGDFTIEFANLSPSNSTSNKDRLSIWNITWEPN